MSISELPDEEDDAALPDGGPPMPPGGGPLCPCVAELADELDEDVSLAFMSESTELILLSSAARALSPPVEDDEVELLDVDLSAVNTEVRPVSRFDFPDAASLLDIEPPPPGGGPPAPRPPSPPGPLPGPLVSCVRNPASAAELAALLADASIVLLVLVVPVVVDDAVEVELAPAFSIVFWSSWTRLF